MKKNKSQKQKGFTLLETLVAIFILTLSITGPVYIASVGFRNTIDSRDNISAQYLAEEVVEVIKNKRDKRALINRGTSSSIWLENILGTALCINKVSALFSKCYMTRDTLTGNYEFLLCIESCPNISFNPASSFNVYGEDGTNQTSKFIREFYIEKETIIGGDNTGVKLVVNIKWNDKGRDKIYTLTERLYDVDYVQFFIPEGIQN